MFTAFITSLLSINLKSVFSAEPLTTDEHDPAAHLIQQLRNTIFHSKYERNTDHLSHRVFQTFLSIEKAWLCHLV